MSISLDLATTNLTRWLASPDVFREIERAKARNDFGLWLEQVTPDWQWHWSHLVYTRRVLQCITSGEVKRLLICEPPRHGKSQMVTIRYPVWRLEGNPELRVIIGAYNQAMASRFSRRARRIARERLELADERTAADDWETSAGGGIRAVGVGSGVTGRGAHLIIVDDPVKSREEANSPAYRERLWSWYTEDLYTRLEPGGAIILIQTRWHQDDLAGRILESEDAPNWTVVNLPAEAEADDPLGRGVGEALCPERFDEADLASIELVLGAWAYSALYQQRPLPQEGGLVQREWFAIVDEVPQSRYAVRAWDLAATEKKLASRDPDYTVGTLMVRDGNQYCVRDVVRARVGPAGVDALILQTAREDGPRVWVHLPQEPGAAGKLALAAQVRMLAGYAVLSDPVSGDKITRCQPFISQGKHGNVSLVRAPWNRAWLDEICNVPAAPHDDQWDSAADAFNTLAQVRGPRPRVTGRISNGVSR